MTTNLPNRITSERHTELLNSYMDESSRLKGWARDRLGEIAICEWEYGSASLTWDIDDQFVMPDGVVFGGHIAAVGDHLVSIGAMTVLTDSKERFRTSRLETNFFRPLTKCAADIVVTATNVSQRLIHLEADIFNADEKLAARINAVQVRRMTG